MITDFIDEIKDFLVSNTSLVFGTDLFIGTMPDTIENSVLLVNSTDPEYTYSMNEKFGYTEYNITIVIRGNEKENETRALANTITDVLENLNSQILGSFTLIRGKFSAPLSQLEQRDDNDNFIYTGNYQSIIE